MNPSLVLEDDVLVRVDLGEPVLVGGREAQRVLLLLVGEYHVEQPLQHELGVEHDEGRHPAVLLLLALSLEHDLGLFPGDR